MHPKVTSEFYRQAYFESSVTIKTTRIEDEDCLLVQGVLAGTLWDKTIKMFSMLFSGFCVCVGLQSQLEQYQADVSEQARSSRLADCHSWLEEQGLWPLFPQGPPALWSLLPMLGQSWQLKIMKTWEGGGEARRERRVGSYFLFMKWLTFSILTLENPFVNYLNKSKQQYKRGDSRFPLGLPTFFSCHLSQDRISPLDGSCLL